MNLTRSMHRHPPYVEQHFGAALELMFVSMLVTIATHAGNEMTASEIAHELSIPRSNVVRILERLKTRGRVLKTGHTFKANMDHLDKVMTPAIAAQKLRRVSKAHRELQSLRNKLFR